ncbi:MAG: hypothetical protein WA947_10845 [Phormidesmis sp.]
MSILVPKQQEVLEEAVQVLWQHMLPSKVALVISTWFSDGGNYLKTRDELFAGETVESLVSKIKASRTQPED